MGRLSLLWAADTVASCNRQPLACSFVLAFGSSCNYDSVTCNYCSVPIVLLATALFLLPRAPPPTNPTTRALPTAQAQACGSGEYVGRGGSCLVCPDGTYQDSYEHSFTSCKTCPPGTYSKFPYSTSKGACTYCPAGSYQPSKGQDDCWVCDDGYFQEKEGQTACKACSPGTYSQFPYATSKVYCQPCPAGSYQPAIGETSCKPCLGRTFQDASGQTRCRACPAGFVVSFDKTACTPCAPGTIQSRQLSSTNDCYYCNYAFWQNLAGQQTCRLCPAGTATMEYGGTAASQCKRYLAGTISFSEEIQHSFFINGQQNYVAAGLRRVVSSGRLDTSCARVAVSYLGLKQQTMCKLFTAYILPKLDVLIIYTTTDGGQANCVVRRGQTQLLCNIFSTGGDLLGGWVGREDVKITGLKITLAKTTRRAAAAGVTPVGSGAVSGAASQAAPAEFPTLD